MLLWHIVARDWTVPEAAAVEYVNPARQRLTSSRQSIRNLCMHGVLRADGFIVQRSSGIWCSLGPATAPRRHPGTILIRDMIWVSVS